MKRVRLFGDALAALKEAVRTRDGWRCTRCGTLGPLQVHHVLPRGRGGGDTLENLKSLCVACHRTAHPRRM